MGGIMPATRSGSRLNEPRRGVSRGGLGGKTNMKTLSVLICCCLFAGCASIVSSSSYPVSVESPGRHIQVTVTNQEGVAIQTATTPFTVTLPASSGFFSGETYTFSGGGSSVVEAASLDPWYFGNIIFGGLIGLVIVDPATGAMWKLPDHVVINPSASAAMGSHGTVNP